MLIFSKENKMKSYINEYGKKVFKGATLDTPFNSELFHEVPAFETDTQVALHTNLGSLTVVDRLTGYAGYVRDIETGYQCKETGLFWLASGGFDVRKSEAKTLGEAIAWVKEHANSCVGI